MSFTANGTSLHLYRFYDDGKIGAMGITPMAGSTLIRLDHDRMVVNIQRQYSRRAEFDAKAAALTPHAEDYYLAARAFLRLNRFFLLIRSLDARY
jgi:hypothetical protein